MSTVVRTMCPMNCHPTLCGMLVEVEDGRVLSVKGDPDNPDGYEATIEPITYCPHAGCLATPYIKTNPDSTKKDNLEKLDAC